LASGISIDEAIERADAVPSPVAAVERPVAIEARGVEKTFRIPSHRIDSLKERAVRPFARVEYRELRALRAVSFDVHKGEFFGIVGRNGSGKSTLLKVLASIYRADAGRIRMAGRVAPFIELGVGLDPELTARENVVLNGVMMGLSQGEARRRLDAVLDFAELRDFRELKLKNYSSGMMVRLAFSVMIQSDANILLIDEVLAVGDAAFQQKCGDAFDKMRVAGRTVVLVTHDMSAVQRHCSRAMLLHDGELRHIGDPEEAARRYLRLNFAQTDARSRARDQEAMPEMHARLVDAWFEDEAGERIMNFEQGQPIRIRVVVEAREQLPHPVFGFHCTNADGVHVFGLNATLDPNDGEPDPVETGQRVRVTGAIENPLTPGRYFISCLIARHPGDIDLQRLQPLEFVVYGTPQAGVVSMRADVDVVPDGKEPS
jgi:ABC-type polysaccharide/polyol phosphate transport system ATPase subunit